MRFSRPKSIRHRFFIGTALVITTALLMFSAVRIYFEARSQHVDLEWQADYLLDISAQSLSSALWQYNEQYVDDYIDALFQFQNVVHVLVSDDQFKVKSRTRDGFKGKGFGTDRQPPGFISRQAEIEYSNVVVGKVDIILSTDHLRQEIINSSFTTIIRMLLIIGLIFFTIYYLSHKYIFTPLTRLERSAQLIGQGNLDAPIDTGENDEIGHLASTFEKMIQSIKAITASRDELDHEIQERKRTEDVLSDTLELLQSAESIGKSGGWFVDVSSGRTEWSTGLYRVYGLAGHEPPGYETHLQCVHPEDRELHNKIFTENQHSRKTHFSHEYRLRLRGGEVRYVLGRYEIIRDNEGQPLYIRGTDRDITDQKLLEQERELLKSAIEQAAESVVITDSEGIIQYANPAFEKMTGFSPDEAIGSKSNIVKGEKIDPLVFSQMWDTLNQAKVWNGNIINNTKDGDHYEEELSISPIKDREGTVSHYVAVSRDVSKEVALENQLRQAMKMEAIGTLTGGIAHDFNNILSGIIGYSEFIQSHVEPDSEVGEDIESILIATRRATDLVRQLLTFSRKVDDKKGPVSIHKVVQDSVKMVRATLPSSIRIEEDIVECGMIIANPINIHQIVINLCTNALHAIADHKGTIGVSLQSRNLTGAALPLNQDVEPGDFAVLTVVDSGCGMARGMLERIFEPYFTTKEMESGTGLGLSVVHGIVQGCKGFIEVESEVGSGTSFHVFFPVAEDLPLEREEEYRKKVEIPAGGGERVMIVDDEPFLVTINKKRLENFGYKVASFTDSKEAYEAFQKRPDDYDLLVTDQTMPGMTGLDLAKGLLAIKPSLPIIMCTGHSETTPKEKALEAGVSKYVYKPLYGDELLLAVLELLRENGKE